VAAAAQGAAVKARTDINDFGIHGPAQINIAISNLPPRDYEPVITIGGVSSAPIIISIR